MMSQETDMRMLEDLHCPKCQGNLSFKRDELLTCDACKSEYSSYEGIPVLVDLDNLPDHLRGQIEYFQKESISDTDYHLEPWQISYVERFRANFPEISGKKVIDCGTGSGYMAIELAKQGARVIACDLTIKSLVRLKKAAQDAGVAERMTIVCCSAETLPFKKGIADYFISNAVLEHLPNERKAIEEINRVCADQSGVMIAVPLSYQYLNPLLLPINFVHDKRIGHLRRYDQEIIVRKFTGFSLKKTYYTGHFKKVLKALTNLVVKIFDEAKIEEGDKRTMEDKWGASNIICFLERN